jgi:hypothetical protein
MLIAAALALMVALYWYGERRARRAFIATLTAEEAERMAGFCAFGLTWRDFRHVTAIERRAVRPSRH